MTNEEKQLLLKDLCARLPYHIIVEYRGANVDLTQYASSVKIENCKPYLRPMSSMTKEEEEECNNCYQSDDKTTATLLVDFYNEHHFDFRGLIPMGLALEAPENMYKTE